ncbi:MAG TPA: hypothetical protein VEA37_08050 [Flavobacterium sp.]|nr:hypothetical protein [Flavobacterium sp.]
MLSFIIMLLNKNLLDEWGYDPKKKFDQQDEEIILAEIENLELFLDAIDNSNYLQTKKDTLLGALCVLYYDNSIEDIVHTVDENTERKAILNTLLPELVKRNKLIKALPEWQLGEYVKAIVYPSIGLK